MNEDPQPLQNNSVNVKVGDKYLIKSYDPAINYLGYAQIVELTNEGKLKIKLLVRPEKVITITKQQWENAEKMKQGGGKRKSRKMKKVKRTRKHKR